MIVYHGTPIGGERNGVARFLKGRHALIPFPRQEDAACAFAYCQTVILDNGAFSAWKSGKPIEDWEPYYEWCESWHRHPAYEWAIIPDVIDGDEDANDHLVSEWPKGMEGVPVWHLHESLDRLDRLSGFRRVCFGSSGKYKTPGSVPWIRRMRDAMEVICDKEGRPKCKVHGLRMCAWADRFPFASVDSTNVAQNASLYPRFGMYCPPQRWQRAEVIAERMESQKTVPIFDRSQMYPGHGEQELAFVCEVKRTEDMSKWISDEDT